MDRALASSHPIRRLVGEAVKGCTWAEQLGFAGGYIKQTVPIREVPKVETVPGQ